MGKTFKDQADRPNRVRGYCSQDIPLEVRREWQSRGGKSRAARKTGHQWDYTTAKAQGIRAYLRQISQGLVFGNRKVAPILPDLEPEIPNESTWEGEGEEDAENLE
jgi:hypothetical protein